MEYTITFDESKSLIVLKTRGQQFPKNYKPLLDELVPPPYWGKGFNVLVDHSDSQIYHLSSQEVKTISNIFLSYIDKFGSIKVAIVASSEADYGMIRMWEIMTGMEDNFSFKTVAFRNQKKALQWLAHQ